MRTVHIDPIIADLVGAGTAPSGSAVQELGCLMGLDAEIEEDLEELESVYAAMEELADMIETGVDAESLDIDHGTVLAQTPVLPEPAPEPVLEVKRRRERRPYSAEQLEVLHNEFHLAARRKNKDIADEISGLNGAREVTTEDVRNWMSSKRHASRQAVPE